MKNKIFCLIFSLLALFSLFTLSAAADGTCPQSADGEHNIITISAREATCTERGNIQYNLCTRCGKYFSDADGTMEIDGDTVFTSPKGHSWNTLQSKEGHYRMCTVCNLQEAKEAHQFSDWIVTSENGSIQIKERTCKVCGYKESMSSQVITVPTVPEHVHKPVFVEKKDATCTEDGNMPYYKCEECGKLFDSETCTHEVQMDILVIAATGHHFDILDYNDSGHWRQCKCGEKLEAEAHDICSQILTSKDGFGNKIHVKREYCSVCEYEKFSNIDDDPGEAVTTITNEPQDNGKNSKLQTLMRKIVKDKIIFISIFGVLFLLLVFLIKKFIQFKKTKK